MLAHRHVHGRVAVVDGQLLVGHRAGEDESFLEHLELADQRSNHRIVAGHGIVAADEDEPVVRVDIPLVVLGKEDVILDLLVRRDPADEQKVHQLVVQQPLDARGGGRAG